MQNAVAWPDRMAVPVALRPMREAHFEAWYLATEIREHRVSWNPDLSGSRLVSTDSVVRDESFAAGGMPIVFDSEPPADAAAMRDYLALHSCLTDPDDPVQLLDAVAEMLGEWTLPPKQQSAVLLMLASMSGIESLGFRDDRLGRPGLAFSATSRGGAASFRSVLVVSADSGAIVSIESVYLGGSADLDVETGSVVRYVAWR